MFLGDILDVPQAWFLRRIRAAHREVWRRIEHLCGTNRVIFARGNHDWWVDYAELFPGATCCSEVLLGETTLAWHGHQLDLFMNPARGVGRTRTYIHSFFERLTGCRLVPPLERYDSWGNRLVVSAAVHWSRLLLFRAGALRVTGNANRADELEQTVRYFTRSVLGDPADLFGATDRTVLGKRFETVICGHSHFPGIVKTARGVYVNTGSWTGGEGCCAHWNGERFRVLDVKTDREIGDEAFVNLPTQTETADLFRWWAQHHKGFLRFELS